MALSIGGSCRKMCTILAERLEDSRSTFIVHIWNKLKLQMYRWCSCKLIMCDMSDNLR